MFSRRTPTDPTIGLGVFFVLALVAVWLLLWAAVSVKAYLVPSAETQAEVKHELCKCGVACACADQE